MTRKGNGERLHREMTLDASRDANRWTVRIGGASHRSGETFEVLTDDPHFIIRSIETEFPNASARIFRQKRLICTLFTDRSDQVSGSGD